MNVRSVVMGCVAGALGVVVACSSSSSPEPTPADFAGSCSILVSRCHPIKTDLGKECHELGHDGDDSKCGPRKAECLAECPESAGDSGPAAPSGDGGEDTGDGGSDSGDAREACAAYCACMTSTCATEQGYPFADEAACLSACAGFVAESRACYAAACEEAKGLDEKEHGCVHASGTVACH